MCCQDHTIGDQGGCEGDGEVQLAIEGGHQAPRHQPPVRVFHQHVSSLTHILHLLVCCYVLADLNMRVITAHTLIVETERPVRSLNMSHASSLVSNSEVVSAARIEPKEKGMLSAECNIVTVFYNTLMQ